MKTADNYVSILKKIAKDALEQIEKEQIDEYINRVKSILFFIGKSVVSIKYLKENLGISSENINLEQIEKVYPQLLSETFKEEEKLFEDRGLLNDNLKRHIIMILNSISDEELGSFSLGQLYESFITNKQRKLLGQVYTPDYIVKYMISCGISSEEIIKNPYFSVVDPACGGGYFLLEAYDRIKEIFEANYSLIIQNKPEVEKEMKNEGIHSFILRNNIAGFDIDPFAVYMTKISLILKGDLGNYMAMNIYKRDILIEKNSTLIEILEEMTHEDSDVGKYDLVIGNPPYIGHKSINKEYRRRLQSTYYDVYSDKADISYCFFKRGYDLLKDNGKLIFITSRYFLEAPSAKGLRNFIKSRYKVEKIVDFYGQNIFSGIGISPVIISNIKSQDLSNNILVYRYKKDKSTRQIGLELDNDFENYWVCQKDLDGNGWLLVKEEERKLFLKINTQGERILDEICLCNQGVITGCDSAFIVDSETIERDNLEKNICKPWVKNSEVRKYKKIGSKRFILYTDSVEDIGSYKNTISHISPYRDRLEKRRECLTGVRKWYELQWGRDINIFKQPKIFFPYKSMSNEFTIEYGEVCCSADVYILSIRDKFKSEISLEYLLAFLNSSLFEFYFKSVAKKLNEGMYEYYPNKLMILKIKLGKERELVENKVKKIMNLYNILGQIESLEGNKQSHKDVEHLGEEIEIEINYINHYFFKLYELDSDEIDIIEEVSLTFS